MNPLNKELLKAASEELALPQAFVEKDWHVVQVLKILSQFDDPQFKLIFSGGTSLSKGFDLINRFSEDIDFKIEFLSEIPSISKSAFRSKRSEFFDRVKEYLKGNGCKFSVNPKKANENKFFQILMKYDSLCPPEEALRPEIQIEMTILERKPYIDPVSKPIISFITNLQNGEPELSSLACINPIETAADKVITFLWRSAAPKKNDERLVRHLYDLDAIIHNKNYMHQIQSNSFVDLVHKVMIDDIKTSRFTLEDSSLESIIRFTEDSKKFFQENPVFESNFNKFVKGMLTRDDDSISFVSAKDTYIKIVDRYLDFLRK